MFGLSCKAFAVLCSPSSRLLAQRARGVRAGGEEHGVGGGAAAERDADADERPGAGRRHGPCKLYVGNLHPNISVRLVSEIPGLPCWLFLPQGSAVLC